LEKEKRKYVSRFKDWHLPGKMGFLSNKGGQKRQCSVALYLILLKSFETEKKYSNECTLSSINVSDFYQ
jgi:hypothetical protein